MHDPAIMPGEVILHDEAMKQESTVYQFHSIYSGVFSQPPVRVELVTRTEILQPPPMPSSMPPPMDVDAVAAAVVATVVAVVVPISMLTVVLCMMSTREASFQLFSQRDSDERER